VPCEALGDAFCVFLLERRTKKKKKSRQAPTAPFFSSSPAPTLQISSFFYFDTASKICFWVIPIPAFRTASVRRAPPLA